MAIAFLVEILSSTGSAIADNLESLITELEAQAITVEFEIVKWDVCDRFSTTSLIKQLTIKSQNCSAKLLVLANFSGFLEREKKWEKAKKQFDELFRYSLDDHSIAIWLEPQKNNVIKGGGFFSRLINWFNQQFSNFIGQGIDSQQNSYLTSSVKVKHPITEGEFRVNLVVIRFDLPQRS